MRCREARRLMSEDKNLANRDLLDHLKTCRACALEARSHKFLDFALEGERKISPGPTSDLSALQTRVQALAAAHKQKDTSIMNTIGNTVSRRRKLTLSLGIVAVMLLFVTLVPFPYSRTVGYELIYGNIDPARDIGVDAVLAGVEALGYEGIWVNSNTAGAETFYTISNLPTPEAVNETAVAFATLTGYEGQPEVRPIVKKVSGSLAAQARDRLFSFDFELSGGTDAEMEAEVMAKLLSEGVPVTGVTVETDADGQSTIQIEIGEDGK